MKLIRLTLLILASGLSFLNAQTSGIDQTLNFVTPPTGGKFIQWQAKAGHSYFLQISDPSDHLNKWNWSTLIERGNDQLISYEVDGTANKSFFRLHYTDQTATDLEAADFDGDGLTNLQEITPVVRPVLRALRTMRSSSSPANSTQTDPLDSDTDDDGAKDGVDPQPTNPDIGGTPPGSGGPGSGPNGGGPPGGGGPDDPQLPADNLKLVCRGIVYARDCYCSGYESSVELYSSSLLSKFANKITGVTAGIKHFTHGPTVFDDEWVNAYPQSLEATTDYQEIITMKYEIVNGTSLIENLTQGDASPELYAMFPFPSPTSGDDFSTWKDAKNIKFDLGQSVYYHETAFPGVPEYYATAAYQFGIRANTTSSEQRSVTQKFIQILSLWSEETDSETHTLADPPVIDMQFTIPPGVKNSNWHSIETPLQQITPELGTVKKLTLFPVDLISDLNNDGQITAADNPLRDAAIASGATDEIKAKGTEYILQDDVMSNGAWDNQDQDGNICFDWPQYGNLDRAPAAGEMDDDAIAIEVKAPSFGVAWFTHEAIGSLSFFREKECLNAIAIDLEQPFDLSTQLPERLWIKFRPTVSTVATVKGKLTFHIGKSPSEEWGKIDLPLTLVPDFGGEKFFEAARNYIFERNTQVFIWDYKMPDRLNPSQIFRLCVMREEATTAKGYDAYANNKKGIGEVALAAGFNQPTVMVNGNQCFFRAGYDEIIEPDLAWDLAHMLNQIADGCHGRLIIAGATTGISSDNFDNTTKPARGSDLAGPDPIPVGTIAGNDGILGTADDILNPMAGNPGGKFFSLSGTTWNFAAGQAIGTDAVGGLSSNYASSVRSDLPHQMVGRAPCSEQGKGCVFTATQIYGVGQAPAFAAAAKKSGNQMLNASTDVFAQQLFILDSGDGSLALEHIDPVGNIRKAYIGRKSATGFPYYVNNYVQFWATKPRP